MKKKKTCKVRDNVYSMLLLVSKNKYITVTHTHTHSNTQNLQQDSQETEYSISGEDNRGQRWYENLLV